MYQNENPYDNSGTQNQYRTGKNRGTRRTVEIVRLPSDDVLQELTQVIRTVERDPSNRMLVLPHQKRIPFTQVSYPTPSVTTRSSVLDKLEMLKKRKGIADEPTASNTVPMDRESSPEEGQRRDNDGGVSDQH